MTIVLKYGGNAMAAPGEPDALLDEVAERAAAGDRIVLVHGGGPQIDAELGRHGIVTPRINGLRVTDAPTLAITERVLCGEVNKALVRTLARRGVRAVGLSGQDGALVTAQPIAAQMGALGFVGEITTVDPTILVALLDKGFLPVIAPVASAADFSTALNVNADTTAGAIAGALRADAYVIVTDVARVRRVAADPASGITRMSASEARNLLALGAFGGGMRPKIESALWALNWGTQTVVVGGPSLRAIASAIAGDGTTLVPD